MIPALQRPSHRSSYSGWQTSPLPYVKAVIITANSRNLPYIAHSDLSDNIRQSSPNDFQEIRLLWCGLFSDGSGIKAIEGQGVGGEKQRWEGVGALENIYSQNSSKLILDWQYSGLHEKSSVHITSVSTDCKKDGSTQLLYVGTQATITHPHAFPV